MSALILAVVLALFYILLLWWACRTLPGERWQMLAAVPIRKNGRDSWQGLNITFYGFFSAGAFTTAGALMVVMIGSLGIAPLDLLLIMAPLLSVSGPASRWIARLVEKKKQTFTVAGAFFTALVLMPWLVLLTGRLAEASTGPALEVVPALAALVIAYTIGEGLGRLACISFGCCYGKPLTECPPLIQRLFQHRGFIFTGSTKKISYAGGLEGQLVLPIQAVTSAVLVGLGLLGFYFFMQGWFAVALWTVLIFSQGWRVFSETLRADYRGGGRLTIYQIMALTAMVYGGIMPLLFSTVGPAPNLISGLKALWNPEVIIALQILWFIVLLYMGRSKVTASTINFHVVTDQI